MRLDRRMDNRRFNVLRRMLICLVLLVLVHSVSRAEVTLEDLEASGGIPEVVAGYLRAFNAQDEPGMRAFLGRHRDAESLERTPLDDRVTRQIQMWGMLGELTPEAVQTSTDEAFDLVVHSAATDAYFLLSFEASAFDPVRFGMMGIRPTDAPGQELPELEGALSAVVEQVRELRELPALAVAVIEADGSEHVVATGVREVGGTDVVTRDDLFHYGSITKSVTSCIAARLVDRGIITYETTLEEGLSGVWLHSGFKPVTLEQLLQHRAGVESLLQGDPEREAKWAAAGDAQAQRRSLAAELLSVAPETEPGTTMSYSNGGYAVVALMLEQASGVAWEEMVRTEVADPLGLASWGIGWPASPERPDQPRGHFPGPTLQAFGVYELGAFIDPAGDVHGSALDLARYGHALATAPEDWIDPATLARMIAAPGSDPQSGYAMGLLREEMAGRAVALHNGSGGTFFAVLVFDPATGDTVAVVMNEGSFANDAVTRAIAEAVLDGSVQP
jgi:CubicO group peptidase (beta-lactamase class C family)